jgi:hypothetical protein
MEHIRARVEASPGGYHALSGLENVRTELFTQAGGLGFAIPPLRG